MNDLTNGWSVFVQEDFASMCDRVSFFRRLGDRLEVIIGFTEMGDPIMRSYEVGVAPDFDGLRLPDGCAAALALHVKPGPSQREIELTQEALDVERRRVDRILFPSDRGVV